MYTADRFADAASYFRTAVDRARELGMPLSEGIFLTNLSMVQIETGELESLDAILARAYALNLEANNHTLIGVVLSNHALLEHVRGRDQPVEDKLKDAVAAHKKMGDHPSLAQSLARRVTHA